MPATTNNPDPLQDHRHLLIRDEPLGRAFTFRRLTGRDRAKIDQAAFDYADGKPERMSNYTNLYFNGCATLQQALVAPPDYSFVDQEDAEAAVLDLAARYFEWRDRFRHPAPAGAGAPGGQEQRDAGVDLPQDPPPQPEG